MIVRVTTKLAEKIHIAPAKSLPPRILKIMPKISVGQWIDAHTIRCRVQQKKDNGAMTKYDFTLILEGSLELTEQMADELFEAGCDDGTPGVCEGVFSIDFHRQADSFEAAIRSAVMDVTSAGYKVECIEIDAASATLTV